jgi:hypothetical protein
VLDAVHMMEDAGVEVPFVKVLNGPHVTLKSILRLWYCHQIEFYSQLYLNLLD